MITSITRNIVGAISLLLIAGTVTAANNNGFRGHEWGSPIKSVVEKEGEPLRDYDTQSKAPILFYKDYLKAKPYAVAFLFINNQLVGGSYIHEATYINKNLYLDDYLELKELLINKYGEPDREEKIWDNELYKGNTEQYGTAVSRGHLRMYTQWRSPDKIIILLIEGSEGKVKLMLNYFSNNPQHQRLIEKVNKQRIDSKL